MAAATKAACELVRLLLVSSLRCALVLANTCTAIPSYCLYLLLLTPLRLWKNGSAAYWRAEGAMYRWLQAIVCSWGWSAGYTVTEWGDDVARLSEDGAAVLVNHQATGDIPALLTSLLDKGTAVRRMMWLMDHVFRYTHFGAVSVLHRDFFIRQGKAHRGRQLSELSEHLRRHFCGRGGRGRWVVLFPEGGFLRKRRAASQSYAKEHGFPHLTHVTLPRLGATQVILRTLGGGGGRETGDDDDATDQTPDRLQWLVDVTIAYPKARPMDMQTWILGHRPPTVTHVHYRAYPARDVPVETEALTDWLYQRFVEKDELLAHFYDTGAFPPPPPPAEVQSGEAEAAVVPGRPVVLNSRWLCGVHLLGLASGYMWYHVLRYLCGCVFGAALSV